MWGGLGFCSEVVSVLVVVQDAAAMCEGQLDPDCVEVKAHVPCRVSRSEAISVVVLVKDDPASSQACWILASSSWQPGRLDVLTLRHLAISGLERHCRYWRKLSFSIVRHFECPAQ